MIRRTGAFRFLQPVQDVPVQLANLIHLFYNQDQKYLLSF